MYATMPSFFYLFLFYVGPYDHTASPLPIEPSPQPRKMFSRANSSFWNLKPQSLNPAVACIPQGIESNLSILSPDPDHGPITWHVPMLPAASGPTATHCYDHTPFPSAAKDRTVTPHRLSPTSKQIPCTVLKISSNQLVPSPLISHWQTQWR